MLPPNEEDENKVPLRWSVKKLWGSKEKEKVMDFEFKVTRSYSTRAFERKILEDAMRVNKTKTIKRIRLKKTTIVEENHFIEVMEVEGGKNLNSGDGVSTKERRKNVFVGERTRFSKSRSGSSAGMRHKYKAVKKRKDYKGPSPKRIKNIEKE